MVSVTVETVGTAEMIPATTPGKEGEERGLIGLERVRTRLLGEEADVRTMCK